MATCELRVEHRALFGLLYEARTWNIFYAWHCKPNFWNNLKAFRLVRVRSPVCLSLERRVGRRARAGGYAEMRLAELNEWAHI